MSQMSAVNALFIVEVKEKEPLSKEEPKTETAMLDESEDKENKGQQRKGAKKESVLTSQNTGTSEGSSVVSVKGLSNLGNTCFFNAVIQVRTLTFGVAIIFYLQSAFIDQCHPLPFSEPLSNSALAADSR